MSEKVAALSSKIEELLAAVEQRDRAIERLERLLKYYTNPSMPPSANSLEWKEAKRQRRKERRGEDAPAGKRGEQGLQVGVYWGEIGAYFYGVPLSITSRTGGRSALAYDTTAESRTVIMPGMSFPECSRWHDLRSVSADPRIMHEYALVR